MITVLQKQTYHEVARHLDIATTNRIRSSRQLPAEWKDNAHLAFAHGLYWQEFDKQGAAAASVYAYHTRGVSRGM